MRMVNSGFKGLTLKQMWSQYSGSYGGLCLCALSGRPYHYLENRPYLSIDKYKSIRLLVYIVFKTVLVYILCC